MLYAQHFHCCTVVEVCLNSLKYHAYWRGGCPSFLFYPSIQLRGTQARGEASGTPDKTTVTEAVKKLTSLIKQLDSLLPYLSVAISAVNLLNAGKAADDEMHAIMVPMSAHTPRVQLSVFIVKACWRSELG